MGDNHSKKKIDATVVQEPEKMSVRKYNKLGVVGRGGFGKVPPG